MTAGFRGPAGPRRVRRVAVTAAAVSLCLLASACTSAPAASTRSSVSSTSVPVPTSSLPTPIVVAGTAQPGSLSFLGPIMRVAVEPVPPGRTFPPLQGATGSPTGGATTQSTAPPAVTIAYRQFGSGADLLLVMGQAGSITWWYPPLLQDLSQHFRVTIFDLPGVGYSAGDRVQASIGRYADITAGLADALGLTHLVVMGWGMGGEVALEVGIRHRGLAAKLVLADSSAGGPTSLSPTPAVASVLVSPASTVTRLASLIFPPDAQSARTAWLQGTLLQPPDDVVAAAITAEATAQAQWWAAGASSAQLADVKVPVLLVRGAADIVFPAADTDQLAAGIPQSRVVTFAHDGYAALFQDESSLTREIVTFAAT